MENMTTISIITMVDMEKEAEETIATLSYLSMGAITIRGTTLTTITVVMVVGTDRSIAAMGRQHIILMGKEWVRIISSLPSALLFSHNSFLFKVVCKVDY